jgi:hypothetical protein
VGKNCKTDDIQKVLSTFKRNQKCLLQKKSTFICLSEILVEEKWMPGTQFHMPSLLQSTAGRVVAERQMTDSLLLHQPWSRPNNVQHFKDVFVAYPFEKTVNSF